MASGPTQVKSNLSPTCGRVRPLRPTRRVGAAPSAPSLCGGKDAPDSLAASARTTHRANSLPAASRASALSASSVNTARKPSFPGPGLSDLRSGIERGSCGCTRPLVHGFAAPGGGRGLPWGGLAPGGMSWAIPRAEGVQRTPLRFAIAVVIRLALVALGMNEPAAWPALPRRFWLDVSCRPQGQWHGLSEERTGWSQGTDR